MEGMAIDSRGRSILSIWYGYTCMSCRLPGSIISGDVQSYRHELWGSYCLQSQGLAPGYTVYCRCCLLFLFHLSLFFLSFTRPQSYSCDLCGLRILQSLGLTYGVLVLNSFGAAFSVIVASGIFLACCCSLYTQTHHTHMHTHTINI